MIDPPATGSRTGRKSITAFLTGPSRPRRRMSTGSLADVEAGALPKAQSEAQLPLPTATSSPADAVKRQKGSAPGLPLLADATSTTKNNSVAPGAAAPAGPEAAAAAGAVSKSDGAQLLAAAAGTAKPPLASSSSDLDAAGVGSRPAAAEGGCACIVQ